MFTGLIETTQPVKTIKSTPTGNRLVIPLGPLAHDAQLGASIAVNGACLTVNDLQGPDAVFDVIAETLRVTTLGRLQPGQPVNLERALRAGDRFGGHLVQGHVDGIGRVDQLQKKPAAYDLWIAADTQLIALMIPKGSVAIDGVSLTIVNVEKTRFSVSLIPTTLNQTTLNLRRPGDQVNLEADLIGKYINQRLNQLLPGRSDPITIDQLRQQGFT